MVHGAYVGPTGDGATVPDPIAETTSFTLKVAVRLRLRVMVSVSGFALAVVSPPHPRNVLPDVGVAVSTTLVNAGYVAWSGLRLTLPLPAVVTPSVYWMTTNVAVRLRSRVIVRFMDGVVAVVSP